MDSVQATADRLGIPDVFVLRRVCEDQYANLDGAGRAVGWGGNVVVDRAAEPLLARAAVSPGVARSEHLNDRVFGPYWSSHAAAVHVADYLVVFGGDAVATIDDDTLVEAAGDIAWGVGEVSVEKRLADELEVTSAALAVASIQAENLEEFLAALADATMQSLSCEFGAVVIRRPEHRLLMARSSWRPDASDDLVLGSLLQLMTTVNGSRDPQITQDVRDDPDTSSPLGFDEGMVSRCIVPIDTADMSAAIVVAHTSVAPRGFTNLCQRVASTIGEHATKRISANTGCRTLSQAEAANGPV